MTKPFLPRILFRKGSILQDEEELVAQKYLPTVHYRSHVPPNSLVIGRYSVLPYYKELEEDLATNGSFLINSFKQHRWIADLKEWYSTLEEFTPKTWFRLEDIPEVGPFVLKGETNSKKFQWNTHMFANNKREAALVCSRLFQDGLIDSQNVYVRQYVPLRKLDEGLNGLPISEEYRFFVLDGKVLTGAFYWSSHLDDLEPSVRESLKPTNVPGEFLERVLERVADQARFLVVDVARTAEGKWIVVELNDGQMSGLSENDPNILYSELAKNLSNSK